MYIFPTPLGFVCRRFLRQFVCLLHLGIFRPSMYLLVVRSYSCVVNFYVVCPLVNLVACTCVKQLWQSSRPQVTTDTGPIGVFPVLTVLCACARWGSFQTHLLLGGVSSARYFLSWYDLLCETATDLRFTAEYGFAPLSVGGRGRGPDSPRRQWRSAGFWTRRSLGMSWLSVRRWSSGGGRS